MSQEFKTVKCEYCGVLFDRAPCRVKPRNFCTRECLGAYNSKARNPEGYRYRDFSKNSARMSELNRKMNPTRMRDETRQKIRDAHLNTGEGKTYTKVFGRHEHRVIAEQMLGRPLTDTEVVHHIDGDKRNNDPSNLMVFPSQVEHAAHHAKLNRKGGDDNEV